MSDLFSAGAPALGYLYQARYALFLLLRGGREDADLSVTVEGLDDVAFDDKGDPVELIQAKHHLDHKATLTDKSSDLWKTLRVWTDRVSTGAIDVDRTVLTLLTTATAPEGSAAAKLRPEESGTRNVEEARERLVSAAKTSKTTDKSLRKAFDSFAALGGDAQTRLLGAVRVLDEAPAIDDTRDQILAALDLFVRPDHKTAFANRVEGWWFDRVIASLTGRGDRSVPYVALRAYITELRDRFTEDDLPADFPDVVELSEQELSPDQRLFIEQLRLVAAHEGAIRRAISDYWRACQQRSQWVADGLLFDDDLEVYERTLQDEWERYFDDLRYQLGDSEDGDEIAREGWSLFHRIDMDLDRPIRPKFRERYVQRGTFHILANGMRVGWHRDFVDRLEAIVERASTRAT